MKFYPNFRYALWLYGFRLFIYLPRRQNVTWTTNDTLGWHMTCVIAPEFMMNISSYGHRRLTMEIVLKCFFDAWHNISMFNHKDYKSIFHKAIWWVYQFVSEAILTFPFNSFIPTTDKRWQRVVIITSLMNPTTALSQMLTKTGQVRDNVLN